MARNWILESVLTDLGAKDVYSSRSSWNGLFDVDSSSPAAFPSYHSTPPHCPHPGTETLFAQSLTYALSMRIMHDRFLYSISTRFRRITQYKRFSVASQPLHQTPPPNRHFPLEIHDFRFAARPDL